MSSPRGGHLLSLVSNSLFIIRDAGRLVKGARAVFGKFFRAGGRGFLFGEKGKRKILRTVDFSPPDRVNYKQRKNHRTASPLADPDRGAGIPKRTEDRTMEQNDRLEKDVISLLDEEGREHEFEIVDALELGDQQYLALVPLYDESQAEEALEDSGELVILRVSEEEDEDGGQYLDAIEDEDEYNRVAELFMGRLEDYFDFEEEEGEEEK